MEKIGKKVSGLLRVATGSMVIMVVLGLIFALAPGFTLSVLHWGITVILLLSGVMMVVRDMNSKGTLSLFSTSVMGIFLILMGIIIAIYPETLNIVTIAFGVYMILNSFIQLSVAARIKGTNAYTAALITNIIGLVCGIIMMVRPGDSNEVIIMIAGIVLMVYGISGLVDVFILRSKIEDFKNDVKKAKKEVKELVEDAKEAEIVEEKKDEKK